MRKTNTKCAECNQPIYRIPSRMTDHNFCSTSCRNKFYSANKSFCWKGGPEARKNRVREIDKVKRIMYKQMAVDYLGGKCIDCGYHQCIAALEFDHRNPKEKEGSVKGFLCGSWEKVKKELDKCDLRCSNCHRERHWKDRHE